MSHYTRSHLSGMRGQCGARVTSETRVCGSWHLGVNYTWAVSGDPEEIKDHYRLKLTPSRPLTTWTRGRQQIGAWIQGSAVLISRWRLRLELIFNILWNIVSDFSCMYICFLSPQEKFDKNRVFLCEKSAIVVFLCLPTSDPSSWNQS